MCLAMSIKSAIIADAVGFAPAPGPVKNPVSPISEVISNPFIVPLRSPSGDAASRVAGFTEAVRLPSVPIEISAKCLIDLFFILAEETSWMVSDSIPFFITSLKEKRYFGGKCQSA